MDQLSEIENVCEWMDSLNRK